MKHCISFIFFILVIFYLTGVFRFGRGKELPELKEENFDSVVNGSSFVFVIFYAPWNNRSVESVKTLEQVFEELDKLDVVVAKVNAYDEVKLSTRFWIDRWPVFKFFIKGSVTPETYQGGTKFNDFLGFIKASSDMRADPSVFNQAVIELDSSNFERIIHNREKHVFVLFYTEWCGACKDLLQTLEKVGENFQNEKDCVLAKIDGDANYDVAVQQEVPYYPALRLYSMKNKDGYVYFPGKYQENWSMQNITKFLNLQCKTKRTVMGRLDETAGRLSSFENLVKIFMGDSLKRQEILSEALYLQNRQQESSAGIYVKVMQQVLTDGTGYLTKELDRIERLMQAVIHPDKADELQRKKNILREFALLLHEKDEL